MKNAETTKSIAYGKCVSKLKKKIKELKKITNENINNGRH